MMTPPGYGGQLTAVAAIIALAYIGVAALDRGIDSVMTAAIVTGIAGLGGFYLHDLIGRRHRGP